MHFFGIDEWNFPKIPDFIEILILGKDVLSIKARSLLTESDYVLVDEVILITQIPVGNECKYNGIIVAYRQISCLLFRSSSQSRIFEPWNKLEARKLVLIRCINLDSHWSNCKYNGSISKCNVKKETHWVFIPFIEPRSSKGQKVNN